MLECPNHFHPSDFPSPFPLNVQCNSSWMYNIKLLFITHLGTLFYINLTFILTIFMCNMMIILLSFIMDLKLYLLELFSFSFPLNISSNLLSYGYIVVVGVGAHVLLRKFYKYSLVICLNLWIIMRKNRRRKELEKLRDWNE